MRYPGRALPPPIKSLPNDRHSMSHSPLSEHERSLLEQLEKQFKQDDPTVAKTMEQVRPFRYAFGD
jgi:hypothetical protein